MNSLDDPFFKLTEKDYMTFRDACESIGIFASPGGGKTANIGKNLAYALLKAEAGGLILTVKGEETRNWIQYAKECGRENDLIIFNALTGHLFDPIFYAWHMSGGKGDIEGIIEFFLAMIGIGQKQTGKNQDPFWEKGVQTLMRAVIVLISLSGERMSIDSIARAIASLPSEVGQYQDTKWQADSYCASLIRDVRQRMDSFTPEEWNDLDVAIHFILHKWPELDVKPRSSLEMTWVGMADKFRYSPLNQLFCSGACTFVPEMATHQGKIILVDFPMLKYGIESGRLINVLIKLVFQRAWLKRDVNEAPPLVFLWQDEFQYFISRHDNFFQQTSRGSRVVTVSITQNILNLSEELGEQQPGSKTKAFLGNIATKIFGQQNDPDTNTYAADLIGKEWRFVPNFHAPGDDKGLTSTGGQQQLLYKVEPDEFSRLLKPDGQQPLSAAVVYQGGKVFNATRTPNRPEGTNHLTVHFSRNI